MKTEQELGEELFELTTDIGFMGRDIFGENAVSGKSPVEILVMIRNHVRTVVNQKRALMDVVWAYLQRDVPQERIDGENISSDIGYLKFLLDYYRNSMESNTHDTQSP